MLSLASKPVQYHYPEDLKGYKLGIREGFYYQGIDELVQSGDVERLNYANDEDNLMALREGLVDALIIGQVNYLYWLAQAELQSKGDVFVARSPHDAFSRRILLGQKTREIAPIINAFIDYQKSNPAWKQVITQYGLSSLYDPIDLELRELQRLQLE